MSYINVK